MNILGKRLLKRSERIANRVGVPLTWHLRLGDFVLRALKEAREDHLPAYASDLAYRALFAIFPSLISLPWVLRVFHATALASALVGLTSTALPAAATQVIQQQLSTVPRGHATSAPTVGVLVSLMAATWAISASFRTIMEAMNVIYRVEETRPLWLKYLISVLLSWTLTALLVAALLLVILGSRIANRIATATGHGIVFHGVLVAGSWLSLLALLLGAFALAYYFAPNLKQRFRWVSEGAVAALLLWLAFTLLFSFYINHLAAYTEIYGALAGIAVLMIYLYAVSYILLLGAEMNHLIESSDPRGARKR